MKNNLSMTRDEQIASILYAVNTLKVRGHIKTQKEFASLLGITEQTLTNAIRGNGRSLNTTLVQRVAHMMQEKYGIDILGPQARIFLRATLYQPPRRQRTHPSKQPTRISGGYWICWLTVTSRLIAC